MDQKESTLGCTKDMNPLSNQAVLKPQFGIY
jgi:hypothetical protein